MDLEETEARNNCASEGQHQFNLTTEWVVGQSAAGKNVSTEAEDIVGILHQATTGEDSMCCSELQSLWISDSAIITRSCNL
jgi:hypothetical protein